MNKHLIAGFDIGTSKIRCILYDLRGNIKFISSFKTPIIKKSDGYYYNPAEGLWNITKNVFKKCIKFSKQNKYEITSLAISSVGESGIPIGKNNKILLDAIPWYDQRTESIRDNFLKKINERSIYRKTGLNSDHFFSAYKILWIKANKPKVFNKIYKWLPISDFIAWKFTNQIATDYSQAMRTMLLDPEKLKWSKFMCNKTNIDINILPKLLPSGKKLGIINPKSKKEFNLLNDCVVGVGGHDHFVGTFALDGFNNNIAVNSLGSAEAIVINTKKIIRTKELNLNKFISGVFKTPNKTSYYIVGSILTSSLVIEWLNEILKIKDYKKLDQILDNSEGVKNNIFIFPQFEYPHSPSKEKYSNGAIWGLTLNSKSGDLYKSILECLSFDTKNALFFILSHAKQKIQKIICVGGGTKNSSWMQIRSNIFNRKIHINNNSENVSLGSAVLAGIASKSYKNEQDAFKKIINKEDVIINQIKDSSYYEKVFKEKYIPGIKIIKKLNNILREKNNGIII